MMGIRWSQILIELERVLKLSIKFVGCRSIRTGSNRARGIGGVDYGWDLI